MWYARIPVKQHFSAYDGTNIAAVAGQVATALERANDLPLFVDMRQRRLDFIARFRQVQDVEAFDDVLADLYDWGDQERVFLGV